MSKDEQQISRIVRLTLTALVVAVFGAFYLLGFHHPWDVDPEYTAPKLTTVLIGFQMGILLLTIIVSVWSVARAFLCRDRSERSLNGVPVLRNALIICGSCALLLLLTFLTAPTTPLCVNGQAFSETMPLRLANMFVISSMVLIGASLLAVLVSYLYERTKK